MPTVVGVRLRSASKTLTFEAAGTDPHAGDHVVVRTERGEEMGEVVSGAHEAAEGEVVAELKPVLRVASDEDLARAEELHEREREAMAAYRELVTEHGLDMKPIGVEYLFDGGKIVFYFVAEERVDFRDLVRDLASRFKARIDMRQVGVRDEARMVGGLGHCGQQLCCVRFGGEFQPVSIRMAKEQDLPLNPLKISGLCGRLMCCLRYEYDAYKEFKSRAPKRGALVQTPLGEGKVSEHNTPRETVTLRIAEAGQTITVPVAKMECCTGEGCLCSVSAEALEEIQGRTLSVLESEREAPSRPEPAQRPARTAKEPGQPRRRKRGRPKGGAGGQRDTAAKAEPAEKLQPQAGREQPSPTPGRRRRRRRSTGGQGTGQEGS